jgi:hypothetical protein
MKGKKKASIATSNFRDHSLLLLCAKCGFVTHKEMREVVGVSERRIRQYLNSSNKYFRLEEGIVCGRTERYYILDAGGRKKLKEMGVENMYKSNSKSHDQCLKDYLIQNYGMEGLARYLSEAELKVRYQNEIAEAKSEGLEISVADGAHLGTDNRVHLIEVITSNYSVEMKNCKSAFAELIGASIEFIRS